MPIVNSYQAAPTAVADFAQDIGYMQEKSRQIAEKRAYSNRLAEINVQYENQSALSRQQAIQRASLAKQEATLREDYAYKQHQLGLDRMAKELNARGDYQSRILAEQFKQRAWLSKANERTKKEAQGFHNSQTQEFRKMEIKQEINRINATESLTPQQKQAYISRLQQEEMAMIPTEPPDNYLRPNTTTEDAGGNTWFVDENGRASIMTYPDNTTEKDRERSFRERLEKEKNKNARELAAENNRLKKEIEQMKIDAKPDPSQTANRAQEQQRKASIKKDRSELNKIVTRGRQDVSKAQRDVNYWEKKAIALDRKLTAFKDEHDAANDWTSESKAELDSMYKELGGLNSIVGEKQQELAGVNDRMQLEVLRSRGRMAAAGDQRSIELLIEDAKKNEVAKRILYEIKASQKNQQKSAEQTAQTQQPNEG